jgi:hypothetical protein
MAQKDTRHLIGRPLVPFFLEDGCTVRTDITAEPAALPDVDLAVPVRHFNKAGFFEEPELINSTRECSDFSRSNSSRDRLKNCRSDPKKSDKVL